MGKRFVWRTQVGVFLGLALLALPAAAQLKVVASFSILADLVQEVGGEQVKVVTLVGPEQDAHAYQARPSDFARLQQADLVVVNGLGFEGWLERAVRGAGYQGPVVVASAGVAALTGGHDHGPDHDHDYAHDHDHDHDHEREHGQIAHPPHEPVAQADPDHDLRHAHGEAHAHGSSHGQAHDHALALEQGSNGESPDPHAWQDPRRVMQYVENIALALIQEDPANAEFYRQRAAAYQDCLQALDTEVAALLQPISDLGVRVITPHESFAYLADRYGLEFVALQGANAVGEAKAGQLAHLIRDLQSNSKAVLFTETVSVSPVLRQLASETGLELQGRLYSDMLSGKAGPASSYIHMMRYNAEQLARAAAKSDAARN